MKNQNLKIGDKLLCKNDYFIPNVYYHKGREYEVCHILNELNNVDDLHKYSYFIIDRINNERVFIDGPDLFYIFYTKKEVRNMKLQKIYEEAES